MNAYIKHSKESIADFLLARDNTFDEKMKIDTVGLSEYDRYKKVVSDFEEHILDIIILRSFFISFSWMYFESGIFAGNFSF